jgi:hypothetical protein
MNGFVLAVVALVALAAVSAPVQADLPIHCLNAQVSTKRAASAGAADSSIASSHLIRHAHSHSLPVSSLC